MKHERLSIFISHPSELLTNHQPHGDGLAAFEFIKQLAERGHTLHVATPATDIAGELPKNIRLYPVQYWTPFSTLNPIEYMLRVRQIFEQIQRTTPIDLIHQLNPVEAGLSYSLLNTGIPLILGLFVPSWPDQSEPPQYKATLLGTLSSSFTFPFVRWCDRQQQKQAAAILLSTPAAATRLYQAALHQNKVHCLPYGIDTDIFRPLSTTTGHSVDQVPSILYLASLNQRKGIFTLLDAFEAVAKAVPTCRLLIAGSGPELQNVKHRLSEMPCRAQVDLLGKVDREQVPQLIQQCTVFCMPSYGEPFGMSALEAMACGKPVVATNLGGLADLVPDQGGRKVPVKDPQALAAALIEILASPELQRSMGEYNRQQVESYYSWDKIIDRLEEIYYGLVSKAA